MNQQNTPTLNSHRSSKDHQNVTSSQTGPPEDGKMRKLLNKFIKRDQNAAVQEEVEMTDMTTTNLQKGTDNGHFKSSQSTEKEESEHYSVEIPQHQHQQTQPKGKQAFNYSSHERNQRNILEGSLGSNDQSEESNQERDFSGFNFEPVSSQINPQQVTFYHPREDNDDSPDNNNQVHIDLESRDISQMEFDTSKDDLNNEEQPSDLKPNQEEDSEDYEYEHHFEGGDPEDDLEEIKYDDDDSASPTPLRNIAKSQHEGHNFTLNPKCQDDDVDVGFQDASPKKHKILYGKNKAPIVVHNDESFQSSSESTPSLETIYKNYRELKQLKTSKLKKILGCTLFVLLGSGLLFLHFLLMSDLTESQFSNWISCTLFSYTVMIFGTDTALYALVSWALKRTNGKIDRRICCSLINLFVYLPLGKWKYQELEIELAKLKDFDQEYGLLAYA